MSLLESAGGPKNLAGFLSTGLGQDVSVNYMTSLCSIVRLVVCGAHSNKKKGLRFENYDF